MKVSANKAVRALGALIGVLGVSGRVLFMAAVFGWAFAAQAETTTFRGVSVDYVNAVTNWVDGALVLTYNVVGENNSLTLGEMIRADLLVVGGGGSGASGRSNYFGYGGGGGKGVERMGQPLPAGDYKIVVGAGGASVKSSTTNTKGNQGKASSISTTSGAAFATINAGGGSGGSGAASSAGSATDGTGGWDSISQITGLRYGANGAKAASSGPAVSADANTGNGGQGAYNKANSGVGGSGVVIVRLTEVLERLKEIDLQLGETVSEFVDASDQPIDFVHSEVTCRSSADVVASVVETADGKVGIVGHLAGTAEVSIITAEKTYTCTVTVSPLITGNYWAGAYEVAVTNASAVKYVDGDLVITYLDTNVATEKSFTLPQPTTGRLLAVGGGGAGGQDDVYSSSCGLPGGGGAGGMVTNSPNFAAATYKVTVGAGGVASRMTIRKVGVGGAASTVIGNDVTLANAFGGGGGGVRSVGYAGGSGGGGSYYSSSKNGGTVSRESPGLGNKGGKGGHIFYGAGGGGAGGPGGDTKSCPSYHGSGKFDDPTDADTDIYCSGAGGAGVICDITGEKLEYARGGAGGVPRLYAFYYYIDGQIYYTKKEPTAAQKKDFDGGRYFTVEASDGLPGRNGYGDGGGGGGQGFTSGTVTFAGSGGDGIVVVRIPPYAVPEGQHAHEWEYAIADGMIVATCTAEGDCFYKHRPPTLSLDAVDAEATGRAYAGVTVVNGITEATGLSVPQPYYAGVNGTVYEETRTPPSEPGEYCVWIGLEGLEIADTFKIVEPATGIAGVCRSQKTAVRAGDAVTITLSASIDGEKAINGGNVLLLGSRCNAHSMATGTVEKAVNALSPYADVRWYAFGQKDPANNLESQLTPKGDSVPYTETAGKVTDETVHLEGGNHFVFKEMMDALYAELVEKKNLRDPYDFILLEFDGDLLGRQGEEPYQLVYTLPEGWTPEKAALLKAAMDAYYAVGRVGWIVPDVNQPKSDSGDTGEYPWTSQPEFVWQRAFLGATETAGYRCPIQVNYEDPDNLVKRLQETVINGFFGEIVVTDTVKAGLEVKKVTPQYRNGDGFWVDLEKTGASTYEADEPMSGKPIKATVAIEGQQVQATFDASEVQLWAVERDVNWGTDLRVKIETEITASFFDGVPENEWQDTNEGAASFDFGDSKLDPDFKVVTTNVSPRIQNVKPDPGYVVGDYVGFYDGAGHAAVVTVTDPDPAEHPFDIRYSLTEDGAFTSALPLTNRCDRVTVWVEIADPQHKYHTVTNQAGVTILPRVVVERANDARVAYDETQKREPGHHYDAEKSEEEAEKLYPGEGAAAIGFVAGEGFASVPMTEDSQQTEIGSHANTIDAGSVTFKENTNPDNYVFIYLPGTIEVVAAERELAVDKVTSATHWPWDGQIGVACDISGAGRVRLSLAVVTNDIVVGEATAENLVGELELDLDAVDGETNGVCFVWNAAADLPEGFHADDLQVKVTAQACALPGAQSEDAPNEVAAVSGAFAFDVRDEIKLAVEPLIAGIEYSDTAWGAGGAANVTLGYTNETTGATGTLASGLAGEGTVEVTLPKRNGDYRLTHSTGGLTSFVKFTVDAWPEVKIPAVTGYTYVVSNATAEIAGELVNGTNTYVVAKGDTVKVYFTLVEGYAWQGEVVNPMTIEDIATDLEVDGMPKATVSFTVSAAAVEKFYDGVPTNIIVTVEGLVAAGVVPVYEYSYSETEGYVAAAAFTGPTNASESAEVWCRVIVPGVTNTVHTTATIKPRVATVVADNAAKIEGMDEPETFAYELGNLVAGDEDLVVGKLARTAGEAPGTYEIGIGTLAIASGNYAVAYTAGTFTIRAKSFVVDPDAGWGGSSAAIDELFYDHNDGLPDADGDGIPDGDVFVELTVKDRPIDDMTDEEQAAFDDIRDLAGDRVVEALNLTLTKYLKDGDGDVIGEQDIPELDNPLVVEVDWAKEGRTCVELYRNVNGAAEVLPEIDVDAAGPDAEGYELDAAAGTIRLRVREFSMYAVGFRGALVVPDAESPEAVFELKQFDEFTSCYYATLRLKNPDGWPNTIQNLRFAFKSRTLDNGVTVKLWRHEDGGTIWGDEADDIEIFDGEEHQVIPISNRFKAVDRCDQERCVWGFGAQEDQTWVDPVDCEIAVFTSDATVPLQELVDRMVVFVKYDSYGWTNEVAITVSPGETGAGDPEPEVEREDRSSEDGSAGGALLGGQTGVFAATVRKQTFVGTLLDASGALAGTVTVTVPKPSKKTGKTTVSAKAVTLVGKKKVNLKTTAYRQSGDTGAFAVTMTGKGGETLTAVMDGDSLTGAFAFGALTGTIDGAKDVFLEKGDAKAAAAASLNGAWTGVFEEADGGISALSVVIGARGKAKVTGILSDGTKVSGSSKLHVGDDWFAVPVMVQKKSVSFGFRLAFGFADGAAVSAVNASPWLDGSSVAGEFVTFTGGRPIRSKAEFKAMTPAFAGRGVPDKTSLSYNAKTGVFSGSAAWGREKAKIFGVEIDGVGYGTAVIKATGAEFGVEVR